MRRTGSLPCCLLSLRWSWKSLSHKWMARSSDCCIVCSSLRRGEFCLRLYIRATDAFRFLFSFLMLSIASLKQTAYTHSQSMSTFCRKIWSCPNASCAGEYVPQASDVARSANANAWISVSTLLLQSVPKTVDRSCSPSVLWICSTIAFAVGFLPS